MIGVPSRAANGQLKKVERAVKKIAGAYDWLNQAPWLSISRNIDVEEGRNAVVDINMPADNTKNAKVSLPAFVPSFLATLWQKYNSENELIKASINLVR